MKRSKPTFNSVIDIRIIEHNKGRIAPCFDGNPTEQLHKPPRNGYGRAYFLMVDAAIP